MRERARNFVTRPGARGRYALISRANASGGWVQRTMKKRWMQTWWRRRKRKRQKHGQPRELRPETNPAVLRCVSGGFDLIQGLERVNLSLLQSPTLLHVATTTRPVEKADSSATSTQLTAPSDRFSGGHNTWGNQACPCIGDTHTDESIPFLLSDKTPEHLPYEKSYQGIGESNDDHSLSLHWRNYCLPRQCQRRSSISRASSNPCRRSTGIGLNSDIHTAFTDNDWVSDPVCYCKKDKAFCAKHSRPDICSPTYELSVPTSPPKLCIYTECVDKTPQARLEDPILAKDREASPANCTIVLSHCIQHNKTKRHKSLIQEQDFSPTAKQSARNFKSSSPSIFKVKSQPRAIFPKKYIKKAVNCRYPRHLHRWLAYWLLVLLGSTSSSQSFNILCPARAAPSPVPLAPPPAYLSSSSSLSTSPSTRSLSLPKSARYRLIPPSQTNESIFIYFSPPSINNLRVNTQQKVSFNFTVQRQGSGTVKSPSVSFQDTTSTSSESAVTTADNSRARDAGKGHVAVVVNDAASDPENDQQLSSTTVSVINDSNSNTNSQVLISETGKTKASNTSHLNEGQGKQAPTAPPQSSSSKRHKTVGQGERYRVMIYSDNDIIARPLVKEKNGIALVLEDARGSYILMDVTAGRTHNFSVEARHIGRVTVSVAVVDIALDKTMHLVRICDMSLS